VIFTVLNINLSDNLRFGMVCSIPLFNFKFSLVNVDEGVFYYETILVFKLSSPSSSIILLILLQ
jgi:hypothetical protein